MESTGFSCISELLLHRAAQAIEARNFQDAVDLIAMVVTEIDEGYDVAGFVEKQIKQLSQEEVSRFIAELSQELDTLCPQPHIGKNERRRMIAFRDAVVPVFGNLGWVLTVCREKSQNTDEQVAETSSQFQFILPQKSKKSHPYS